MAKYPRPLAEIADHLFPDRSDQIDPKAVPLDERQAQVNRLKKYQVRTAEELDALLPAVLDRAFRGRL